jgi:NAD+ synthetase
MVPEISYKLCKSYLESDVYKEYCLTHAKNIWTNFIDNIDIKALIDNIRNQVSNYVKTNKLKSLVLPLSGGLDSSICAALLQEEYIGVPLLGIYIPINSSEKSEKYATKMGIEYCSNYDIYNGFDGANPGNIDFKLEPYIDDLNDFPLISEKDKATNRGNFYARLRMIYAYNMARNNRGVVVSTDNLSEKYMGFWTLHGDVGDICPLQNLSKGFLLPAIAKELGLPEEIINQVPSDDLGVTEENTDEAQLGASYKMVDILLSTSQQCNLLPTVPIFEDHKEFLKVFEDIMLPLIQRKNRTEYKRIGPVEIIPDIKRK